MSHDHSHSGSSRRHIRVAGIMFCYALFELVVWRFARNPLILADATHNFSDVLYPALSAIAVVVASKSKRHSLACYGPTLFSAAAFVSSLVLLIVIELRERNQLADLDRRSLIAGMALAFGSLLVNLYSMMQLEREHGAIERASWSHFLLDATISGTIMLGTGLRLVFGWRGAPAWTLGIVIIVFSGFVISQLRLLPRRLHYGRPHTNAPA